MPDLAELRARAAAHTRAIDMETRFFTPRMLAERWHCSRATVYNIPPGELPFLALGGPTNITRRYHPDDVAAYERKLRPETSEGRRA